MDKRTADMVALYKGGRNLQDIGGIYGISRQRVHQILKKFGVTFRARGGVRIPRGSCLQCGTLLSSLGRRFCSIRCSSQWRWGGSSWNRAVRAVLEQRLSYKEALISAGLSPSNPNIWSLSSRVRRKGRLPSSVAVYSCRRCGKQFEAPRRGGPHICPHCDYPGRADCRILVVNGVSYSIRSAAKHWGLSYNCIYYRLNRGWSESDAVKFPPDASFRYKSL